MAIPSDGLMKTEFKTTVVRTDKRINTQHISTLLVCKRLPQLAGWKSATTDKPPPELPQVYFSFSDGVYNRQFVLPLAFSCAHPAMSFSDVKIK